MKAHVAIILAAGQGKRMKSMRPKVLHPLAGTPMVVHVFNVASRLGLGKIMVVIGHQADRVREALSTREVTFLLQDPPLGTGHAVMQAKGELSEFKGSVFILNADTPLLREETLFATWEMHQRERAVLTLLTTTLAHPAGYGRIIRRGDGTIDRVVEEKDATPTERRVKEVNCGIYVVEVPFLFNALEKIAPNNQQQEYYLTNIIEIASRQGFRMAGFQADPEEVMGVNSRADLAAADAILRRKINGHWMAEGVTLMDPASIRIEASVKIGRDTVIYPGVILEGETEIGEGCTLSTCRIKNTRLQDQVVIKDYCVIEDARIESGVTVGPFAHIRPGTLIRKGAKVGNFVEIKKTDMGEGSKANHLSYLGDAVIGKRVNIGAGTITCNYDGEKKHQTVIDDDVFVGSDTQFVAPVHVGARALIAAGSTITQDVPPDTLSLSRVKQENKVGWMAKRKRKKPEKHD